MPALISIIVVLVVVCLLVWAVQSYLPFSATPKNLICFVIILVAVLYVLDVFGLDRRGRLMVALRPRA